jgi:hypothetical protein
MFGGFKFSACCVEEQVMLSCSSVGDGFTIFIWWGTISFRGNTVYNVSAAMVDHPILSGLWFSNL